MVVMSSWGEDKVNQQNQILKEIERKQVFK